MSSFKAIVIEKIWKTPEAEFTNYPVLRHSKQMHIMRMNTVPFYPALCSCSELNRT